MCSILGLGTTLMMLAAVLAVHGEPLRCLNDRCRYIGENNGAYLYEVDGNNLTVIGGGLSEVIMFDCHGGNILESPGMPRAEPALRLVNVWLSRCALPANSSLAHSLRSLNVTLRFNKPTILFLNELPAIPQLASYHFAGLKRLEVLGIGCVGDNRPRPARGFLAPLRGLRSLRLCDEALPAGELDLPPTLFSLKLAMWKAQRPAPLESCGSLRTLELIDPEVVELPNWWLENCSQLQELVIEGAKNLKTLPSNLLGGASALRRLDIVQGALERLPEGLLDNVPNLFYFNMRNNRLRTLPSDLFAMLRNHLWKVDLSSNDLRTGSLEALEGQNVLYLLNLSNNTRLGDLCEPDGYSPIRKSVLTMDELYLNHTGVSRVCRDWREDLLTLMKLDLSHTNVDKLSIEDLLFRRKIYVQKNRSNKAKTVLKDVPASAVEMSRDFYNKLASDILNNTRHINDDPYWYNFAEVELDMSLECDCRMYWVRRALELPRAKEMMPPLGAVGGLPCRDGRLLREVPPEDLTCEDATTPAEDD